MPFQTTAGNWFNDRSGEKKVQSFDLRRRRGVRTQTGVFVCARVVFQDVDGLDVCLPISIKWRTDSAVCATLELVNEKFAQARRTRLVLKNSRSMFPARC